MSSARFWNTFHLVHSKSKETKNDQEWIKRVIDNNYSRIPISEKKKSRVKLTDRTKQNSRMHMSEISSSYSCDICFNRLFQIAIDQTTRKYET